MPLPVLEKDELKDFVSKIPIESPEKPPRQFEKELVNPSLESDDESCVEPRKETKNRGEKIEEKMIKEKVLDSPKESYKEAYKKTRYTQLMKEELKQPLTTESKVMHINKYRKLR